MVPPKVARPISFTSLRTLALILALAICSAAPAQDFIRGEANGNGSVAIEDVIYLMNYFYESGLAPVNACGAFTFDLADINDNEYLTIADPLRLAEALFLGGSIPAPYPTCGPDPSNQTNGFDVIDTAYKVRLLGPFDGIDTSGGNPQRTAGFEVGINVPSAVRAVELYFQYDPAELSNPRYQGVHPLTIGEVAFGVIRLTLQGAFSPLDVHPGLNRLGEIVFDVAPGVLAPQLDWVPVFSAAFFRRATIVDDVLEDHHPEFIAVDASVFIRGDLDANGIRNVQDLIIWLVTYTTGSPQPVSLCDLGPSEAADVNDNEFLTVADFLLLGVQLFCGGTAEIPTPNYCGVDPGSEMDDFDLVDPAYSVRAERFTLIGAGPVERDVEIPLWILTPEPVRGVEFTLDLGTPNLTLDSPFFEPAGTLVDPVSANRQEGSLLHVVIASTCSSIIEGECRVARAGDPEAAPRRSRAAEPDPVAPRCDARDFGVSRLGGHRGLPRSPSTPARRRAHFPAREFEQRRSLHAGRHRGCDLDAELPLGDRSSPSLPRCGGCERRRQARLRRPDLHPRLSHRNAPADADAVPCVRLRARHR